MRSLLALAALAFLFSAMARADRMGLADVTGTATALGNGLYHYDYTITNTHLQGVPGPPIYNSAGVQVGNGPNVSDTLMDFHLFMDHSQWGNVAPLQNLQGIGVTGEAGLSLLWGQRTHVSFDAPLVPTMIPYQVMYSDPSWLDPAPQWYEGTVIGPSGQFTPEPSSLTLLGLGASCLAGYGWRRKPAVMI